MKLMPCPFCGGETIAVTEHNETDDNLEEYTYHTIICRTTGCAASISAFDRDTAISKWNTRVSLEEQVDWLKARVRLLLQEM